MISACIRRSLPRADMIHTFYDKNIYYALSNTSSRVSTKKQLTKEQLFDNVITLYKYFVGSGIAIDFKHFNFAMLYSILRVIENIDASKSQKEYYQKLLPMLLDFEKRFKINLRLKEDIDTLISYFLKEKQKFSNQRLSDIAFRVAMIAIDKQRDITLADKYIDIEKKFLLADSVRSLWSKQYLWYIGLTGWQYVDRYQKLSELSSYVDDVIQTFSEKNTASVVAWYQKVGALTIDGELRRAYEAFVKAFFEFDIAKMIISDVSSAVLTATLKSRIVSILLLASELAIFSRFRIVSTSLKALATVFDKSLISFLGMQIAVEWYIDGVIQRILETPVKKLNEALYGIREKFGLLEEEFTYLVKYLVSTELRGINLHDETIATLLAKLPEKIRKALLLRIKKEKAYRERRRLRLSELRSISKQLQEEKRKYLFSSLDCEKFVSAYSPEFFQKLFQKDMQIAQLMYTMAAEDLQATENLSLPPLTTLSEAGHYGVSAPPIDGGYTLRIQKPDTMPTCRQGYIGYDYDFLLIIGGRKNLADEYIMISAGRKSMLSVSYDFDNYKEDKQQFGSIYIPIQLFRNGGIKTEDIQTHVKKNRIYFNIKGKRFVFPLDTSYTRLRFHSYDYRNIESIYHDAYASSVDKGYLYFHGLTALYTIDEVYRTEEYVFDEVYEIYVSICCMAVDIIIRYSRQLRKYFYLKYNRFYSAGFSPEPGIWTTPIYQEDEDTDTENVYYFATHQLTEADFTDAHMYDTTYIENAPYVALT